MSALEASDFDVDGDPNLFAELYEQAQDALLPVLRRRVGSAADDLFQEALLIAFERWDRVCEVENQVAWLRTVAMRLAGRWQQREARRSVIEATTRTPANEIMSVGSDLDLLDALTRLRPEHAAAFRLIRLDDLDIATASKQLGVAEPTVKVWVHRGRQRLAEHATGLRGRWMCEAETSGANLEPALIQRGHGRHVDSAMPCLVDRRVRWQLEVADGKYWLGTDDGEQMDQGDIRVGAHGASLRSVRLGEWVDGVSVPSSVRDIGTSVHAIDLDGNRLRLRLVSTEIQPTNGVPDIVFREVFFHDIVYRWVGPPTTSDQLARSG